MLERKDRNTDRGKAEELGGPGSAAGGQYLGRAGKSEKLRKTGLIGTVNSQQCR